jgi:hypothetical protein
MTERTFEHARAIFDAMTIESRERVLDHFDDMLPMYVDAEVRTLFVRAVAAEFDAIERLMLLKRQSGRHGMRFCRPAYAPAHERKPGST